MRRFAETFFKHLFSVDETVKSILVFCSWMQNTHFAMF